jgi:hypothetical protein
VQAASDTHNAANAPARRTACVPTGFLTAPGAIGSSCVRARRKSQPGNPHMVPQGGARYSEGTSHGQYSVVHAFPWRRLARRGSRHAGPGPGGMRHRAAAAAPACGPGPGARPGRPAGRRGTCLCHAPWRRPIGLQGAAGQPRRAALAAGRHRLARGTRSTCSTTSGSATRSGSCCWRAYMAAADRGVKVRVLFDDLNTMLHDMSQRRAARRGCWRGWTAIPASRSASSTPGATRPWARPRGRERVATSSA